MRTDCIHQPFHQLRCTLAFPNRNKHVRSRIWLKTVLPILLIPLSLIALVGCTPPIAPTEDPTSSPPTRTSPITLPETVTPTITPPSKTPTAVDETVMISTPEPTPPIDLRGVEACQPFPDEMQPGPWGFIDVRCGDYITGSSPEEFSGRMFLDYTSLSGRMAYHSEKYDLWVHDYRIDQTTMWLESSVAEAKWAPTVHAELGAQPLAILQHNGSLDLLTAPGEITHLADLGDARDITWSPDGDAIAYVKDYALYLLPWKDSQPQLISEPVYGEYLWDVEQNFLFVDSAQVKIVTLDGASFTPTTPEGKIPAPELEPYDSDSNEGGVSISMGSFLWSPERRLLVFGRTLSFCMGCDSLWVYELSEDLRTIVNYYFESPTGDIGYYPHGWGVPGEIVETSSRPLSIIPGEEIQLQGNISGYDADHHLLEGLESRVFLTRKTQIIGPEGSQIDLSAFHPWVEMEVEVSCRSILDRSCIATRLSFFERVPSPSSRSLPPSTPEASPTPSTIPDQVFHPARIAGAWGELFLPYDEGYYVNEVRDGQVLTYVKAPVEGAVFWQYTPISGRLAFGKLFLSSEGASDLWVYDYSREKEERWLSGYVTSAIWAPIQNPVTGVQPIAVTLSDGALAILNGPYKITPIAENACCMSWSPRGDALSFVREDELYVVYFDSGEERKVADGVDVNPSNPFDWPIWALEQQAIFFLDSPIRVAWLNGTGSFTPRTKDGNLLEASRGKTLLWSPERRILVFEEDGEGEEPWYGRIWIYTLSEDLKTIVDETFIPDAGHSLISWMERGESVIIDITWETLELDTYSNE